MDCHKLIRNVYVFKYKSYFLYFTTLLKLKSIAHFEYKTQKKFKFGYSSDTLRKDFTRRDLPTSNVIKNINKKRENCH